MTTDTAIVALSSLTGLLILSLAALRGWQGWLALKARELEACHAGAGVSGPGVSGSGMARIEIADLKERIRKLEAIAAGVDL